MSPPSRLRRPGAMSRPCPIRSPPRPPSRRLAMSDTPYAALTQLGTPTSLPASPEDAVLERVENPHPGTGYVVRFTCPDFTSLCPITGQPAFAHLVIDYVPGDWRSEEHTSELQSLMRISYAVFCLKKKKTQS